MTHDDVLYGIASRYIPTTCGRGIATGEEVRVKCTGQSFDGTDRFRVLAAGGRSSANLTTNHVHDRVTPA